jgi:hypothetical protein
MKNKKIQVAIYFFVFLNILLLFISYNRSPQIEYFDSNDFEQVSLKFDTNAVPGLEGCVSEYKSENLVKNDDESYTLDMENVGSAKEPTWSSTRAISEETFSGDFMLVINVDNIPEKGNSFPAIWLWSNMNGEIDIMETTNVDTKNFSSTLVVYKENTNDRKYSTQEIANYIEKEYRWPESYIPYMEFPDEKNKPHTFILLKKKNEVWIYVDPTYTIGKDTINITKNNSSKYTKKYYDLNKTYENGETFKKLYKDSNEKDTNYHLVFNLEPRHYKMSNNIKIEEDSCKHYDKSSFIIKSIGYKDISGFTIKDNDS